MDILFMICVSIMLLVAIMAIFFKIKKKYSNESKQVLAQETVQHRSQIERNQRNRLGDSTTTRSTVARNEERIADGATDVPKGYCLNDKVGSKKKAKVEAKQQKKQNREQELREREKQNEIKSKQEEELKRQNKQIADEEHRKAETERLAREKQERQEFEEYLKLTAHFSVEDEGFDDTETNQTKIFINFVEYIKDNKVVVLEDLSSEFQVKTQQVIDQIIFLQELGSLTGVIDDRGKFVYISEEELQAVVKFIANNGRVSIVELAANSNQLINLTAIASKNI